MGSSRVTFRRLVVPAAADLAPRGTFRVFSVNAYNLFSAGLNDVDASSGPPVSRFLELTDEAWMNVFCQSAQNLYVNHGTDLVLGGPAGLFTRPESKVWSRGHGQQSSQKR